MLEDLQFHVKEVFLSNVTYVCIVLFNDLTEYYGSNIGYTHILETLHQTLTHAH